MCPPGLTTIPPEVLDEIAFHTVLPAPLGPPTDLHSLLISAKSIHTSLSTSHALYSRIFRTQFDFAAIIRRYRPEALNSQLLADHLKVRWTALKRIKRIARVWQSKRPMKEGPYDVWLTTNVTEDLWIAFSMLIESDGLNARQLLDWADLRAYLEAFITSSLYEKAKKHDFQPETFEAALAIWISWLLTDEASLNRESVSQLGAFIGLIRPFVFGAHRYDAYFGPWSRFDLPVTNPPNQRLPPRYRYVRYEPYHAGDQTLQDNTMFVNAIINPFAISTPIMALAAINAYFARVELHLRARPAPPPSASNTGAGPAPHPGQPSSVTTNAAATTIHPTTMHYPRTNDSTFYDDDYNRLVGCLNPTHPSMPEGQTLWKAGAMAGVWEGRFAYFEFDAYRDMLVGFKPPASVKVDELLAGQQPQVWRINEYHLYHSSAAVYREMQRPELLPTSSSAPVMHTMPIAALPTGPALNAHLPERSRFREVDGGLEVHLLGKPNRDCLYYTKYVPPVNTDAAPNLEPILDILITGSGHSAWGPFVLKGRVRTWDGLVTVVKDYSSGGTEVDDASAHDRGTWLYRGYLLGGGRNWVGRWRDTVTQLEFCGYEGAFALHVRE